MGEGFRRLAGRITENGDRAAVVFGAWWIQQTGLDTETLRSPICTSTSRSSSIGARRALRQIAAISTDRFPGDPHPDCLARRLASRDRNAEGRTLYHRPHCGRALTAVRGSITRLAPRAWSAAGPSANVAAEVTATVRSAGARGVCRPQRRHRSVWHSGWPSGRGGWGAISPAVAASGRGAVVQCAAS